MTDDRRIEMRQLLQGAIDRYNSLTEQNEYLEKKVTGKQREVEIRVKKAEEPSISGAEEIFHLHLDGVRARSLGDGANKSVPDIVVESEHQVLVSILEGVLSPMKALAKKQLIVKAPIRDLLLMRRLFSKMKA